MALAPAVGGTAGTSSPARCPGTGVAVAVRCPYSSPAAPGRGEE